MADVLYGVTMQEHGVSRIVSVKFHKSDDEGAEADARPLVPHSKVLEQEEDKPREHAIDVMAAR